MADLLQVWLIVISVSGGMGIDRDVIPVTSVKACDALGQEIVRSMRGKKSGGYKISTEYTCVTYKGQ